ESHPYPQLNLRSFPGLNEWQWLHHGYALVWLALLPSGFWDYFSRKLANRPEAHIRAYYDGDCGFCRRTIRLLHTFLGVHYSVVATAQADAEINAIMEKHHSWVVRDHNGRTHVEFPAILRFVESGPLGPVLRPL